MQSDIYRKEIMRRLSKNLVAVAATGLATIALPVASIAQNVNFQGGADLGEFLKMVEAQGAPTDDPSFVEFKEAVEGGLESVSFAVTGSIADPDSIRTMFGLHGDAEHIKGLVADPDGPLKDVLVPDPTAGEGRYLIQTEKMTEIAGQGAGEVPAEAKEPQPVKMTEINGTVYFVQPDQTDAQTTELAGKESILPGNYERIFHIQSALPEDIPGSVQSGIGALMAAGQGSPQAGQMMMMMGFAMPIITDLANSMDGIGTMAIGYLQAADGKQVIDFAQSRRDPSQAAAMKTKLDGGSYASTGVMEVFNSLMTAPGMETKHIAKGDRLFTRMSWAPEATEGIGEAVMGAGMMYFQSKMGGAGAAGGGGFE